MSNNVLAHLLTALKSWHSAKNRANSTAKLKLLLERNIQNKMSLIFSTLEKIDLLLQSSTSQIDTYNQAKLYLLTKFKDIIGILDNANKDSFIDQINQFIPYWLVHHKAPTRIKIRKKLIIRGAKYFILIDGFRDILIEEPNQFQKQILNKCKTVNLLKIDDEFFIELDRTHFASSRKIAEGIEEIENNLKNKTKINPHKNKPIKRKISRKENGYKQDFSTPIYTLQRMEEYLRFIDKVNRSFTKTDFDKLEGWHTQGGLPSLGKRR